MVRHASMAVPVLLLFTGLAEGATLLSPPLQAGADTELVCLIANVGTKTRALTVDWIAQDGTEGTVNRGPLGPGFSFGVITGIAGGLCRFEVQGGKNEFRAVACLQEDGLTYCTGAVEAR
jgi:hypothetical protein